jgi:hypothetical protein
MQVHPMRLKSTDTTLDIVVYTDNVFAEVFFNGGAVLLVLWQEF